ncbi:SirB1 family protein [Flavisphingomonas formosensis]|uniref:SirB1 family protein n=1 Tax=Flavisphingomonas formosensis TaxID=861534 RepID=UPI0012FC5E18|nr:transglutaminase-like domain-containing protein [Sphingomonas formosensis]
MSDSISYLGLIEDDAIALDTAALELAALDHPDVDLAPYGETIEAIEERLSMAAETLSSESHATALSRVIGQEFGFSGDRESYDDPANADLIQVIDRRRGLPVSLSILYVGAARRMGWEAYALNSPGHVLVRIGGETEPVLADPFDGGAIVGVKRLAEVLAPALAPGIAVAPHHLQPMSNRAVLTRLLLNQATRAEASGDSVRAIELFDRITTIAPDNVQGWWELARLALGIGETERARQSLAAILEITRDPRVRERVAMVLGRIGNVG